MANWILKAHAISGSADGAAGPFVAPHTGTVNASGADLYLVWIAYYFISTMHAGDVTDNSGNSYTLVSPSVQSGDSNNAGAWLYKLSPVTSTTEKWTLTSTNGEEFAGVIGLAFSGSDGSSAPGSASSGTTSQTPTGGTVGTAGQLVVSGVAFYQGDTSSIDSSFAIIDHNQYNSGNNIGIGAAWQNASGGVSGSVNPQWSLSIAPSSTGVHNLAFTPSAGGASTKRPRGPNVVDTQFHSSYRERIKKPTLEEIMYYNKRKAA